MNRRGFFSLLAGASVAALAPALLARPDYRAGQVFTFKPAVTSGPVTLSINGMRYHPLMPSVVVREHDGRPYRVTERDGWLHIEEIQMGPAFAAGGVGANVAPAGLGAASFLLSTLTPPPVALAV